MSNRAFARKAKAICEFEAHEVINVGSDRSELSRMSERARVAIGSEAIEGVADRGCEAQSAGAKRSRELKGFAEPRALCFSSADDTRNAPPRR